MKYILITVCLIGLLLGKVCAQVSSEIFVGGDGDKFYPVTLTDPGWDAHVPTKVTIGRSHVHWNMEWIGTIMAEISYHTNNYGHLSQFIDVQLYNTSYQSMIAGWLDVTDWSADQKIMVWLKGGGLTYSIKSPQNVVAKVYDGVQHELPYQQPGGVERTFMTAVSPHVNRSGLNVSGTAFFMGGGTNFINGNLGIGTTTPGERLAVNGNIRAKEIKVTAEGWPDYVFSPSYVLPSIKQTEDYITRHGHLPSMPSAKEVERDGAKLGEMVSALLKNQEHLTLYIISQQRQLDSLKLLVATKSLRNSTNMRSLNGKVNRIKNKRNHKL